MAQTYYTSSGSFHIPDMNCRFDIDEEDEAALSIIRSSITDLLSNNSECMDNILTDQHADAIFFSQHESISPQTNIFHSCGTKSNIFDESKINPLPQQKDSERPRSSNSLPNNFNYTPHYSFSHMNTNTPTLPVDFGPRCTRCGNPCGDDVIYQGNLAFHSAHFTCKECRKNLKVGILLNNDVYCQSCAAKVTPQSNNCCVCNSPRPSASVVIGGRCFCKEHFVCACCGKILDPTSYKRSPIDGNFYCESHCPKEDTFPMCAGCGRPIVTKNSPSQAYSSISSFYPSSKVICASICGSKVKFHSECFNCYICNKSLVDLPKYTVYDGRPICVNCFKQLPREVQTSIASGGNH